MNQDHQPWRNEDCAGLETVPDLSCVCDDVFPVYGIDCRLHLLEKEMLNTMKKILAVLTMLTLIVSCLSAAFAEEGASAAETTEPASHILIVCFSATGTTRGVAEKLAEGLSADLYEIVPEEPYTDADLNYNDRKSRTSIETDDPSCRPAIAGELPDLTAYDTVLIGYPIWWGDVRASYPISWSTWICPARPWRCSSPPAAPAWATA